MYRYIRAHWRGELSLAQSFWVNVFALNVLNRGLELWFSSAAPVDNPQISARIILLYFVLTLCVIYPWQVIGLWRSASRHANALNKRFWPGVVKALVLLGVLATLGRINLDMPIYRDLYKLGISRDEFSDYQVSWLDDKRLIHLKGSLGFGVADEVAELIENHSQAVGIILDSPGGRIYESRELSKLILRNQLDTYSLTGCYSACGTAFISGARRYLAQGANLGFHRYRNTLASLNGFVDMNIEQQKDLLIYKRKGVSQSFIDRLFSADSSDLWYPTIDEMQDAGVIHGIVTPSDLKPVKYDAISKHDLVDAFNKIEIYRVIKKYDTPLYNKIIDTVYKQFKAGGSLVEIQQVGAQVIQSVVIRALPSTSDDAVILFTRETISLLDALEKQDPILCLKNLYPDRYGALDITRYIDSADMQPMLNAFHTVLVDGYTITPPEIDVEKGEKVIESAAVSMGDDARYLAGVELNNSKEYSKACRAVIHFYEHILANDAGTAANALRYAYRL